MGDEVQALKAGVMEIADIFVVNKADRDGADRAVAEIESLLGLHAYEEGEWRPPIVRTAGDDRAGPRRSDRQRSTAFERTPRTIESRRRERAAAQLRAILAARLMRQIESRVSAAGDGETDRSYRRARRSIRTRAADEIVAAGSPRDKIMKAILDHVGIAVADLDASLTFFRDALGLDVEPPEDVAVAARPRAVRLDRAVIARAAAGDVARFADREVSREARARVCITSRCESTTSARRWQQLRAARRAPHRRGAAGPAPRARCVAFIHPSSAQGVLVELKQVPATRARSARAAEDDSPRRHRDRDRVGRLLLSRRRRDVRRDSEDVLGEESAARRSQSHPHGDAMPAACAARGRCSSTPGPATR